MYVLSLQSHQPLMMVNLLNVLYLLPSTGIPEQPEIFLDCSNFQLYFCEICLLKIKNLF